jgi:hypothetical protein
MHHQCAAHTVISYQLVAFITPWRVQLLCCTFAPLRYKASQCSVSVTLS